MITTLSQRWRTRRDTYRPAGETIRTIEYEVAVINDDRTAKAFVLEHHYTGSYPAARYRFGLYHRSGLSGVAVFSHPANERVLSIFPGSPLESVELGRFVLLDEVPGNGETWFLSRAFELLRHEGLVGVLSFSDPTPRDTADGRRVFRGHIGTIYQAGNAAYLGRGSVRTLRLLPNGAVLSARAISKVRARERGWRYAAALLEEHGAAPLSADEDAGRWLARWLPALTRPFRHPGNHRYAWALDRRVRRQLPAGLPYPKFAGRSS